MVNLVLMLIATLSRTPSKVEGPLTGNGKEEMDHPPPHFYTKDTKEDDFVPFFHEEHEKQE